jgi:methanol metabolism-related c-type cytochrome
MTRNLYPAGAGLAVLALAATMAWSQDAAPADPAAAPASAPASGASDDPNVAVAYEQDGRYFTAEDVPTYNVGPDGTVDWPTYSGFRRYHAECHVCHGPDGEGSSYAPAIKNSAVEMDYYDFYDVVVNGKQNVNAGSNQVMPAFGDNANVMCYLDDIYVYLKARGTDAIPRGRPAEREDKSDVIGEDEDACLGT